MIGTSRKLAHIFFTLLADCVNASEATLFIRHILAISIYIYIYFISYAFQNVCSFIGSMKHLLSEFMKK